MNVTKKQKKSNPFDKVTIQRQELRYYKQCENVAMGVVDLFREQFGTEKFMRRLNKLVALEKAIEPLEKERV